MDDSKQDRSAIETLLQQAGSEFQRDFSDEALAEHRRRAVAASLRTYRQGDEQLSIWDRFALLRTFLAPQTVGAFALGCLSVLAIAMLTREPAALNGVPQLAKQAVESEQLTERTAMPEEDEPLELALVVSYEDILAEAEREQSAAEEEDSLEENSNESVMDDAIDGLGVSYQPLIITSEDIDYYDEAEEVEYTS